MHVPPYDTPTCYSKLPNCRPPPLPSTHLFVVTPFYMGGDLLSWVELHGTGEDNARRWFRQILLGLAYIHQQVRTATKDQFQRKVWARWRCSFLGVGLGPFCYIFSYPMLPFSGKHVLCLLFWPRNRMLFEVIYARKYGLNLCFCSVHPISVGELCLG